MNTKKSTPGRKNPCLPTRSGSPTCLLNLSKRLSDVSFNPLLTPAVIDKCNENMKFDKDVAKEITRKFALDQDLCDECAGWHVIVGKSFASAIQYQTKCVLMFDLLGETHKSFLVFKT